jgi:hypothetical protein
MERNNNINKTRERERTTTGIFFFFLWTESEERIGAAIMEEAWHAALQVSAFVLMYQ